VTRPLPATIGQRHRKRAPGRVETKLRLRRLADIGQRHLIDEDDLLRGSRAFRAVGRREGLHLVCRGSGVRHQLDIGDRQLASIGIRHAHRRRKHHFGVLEQSFLDDRRIDVVPATDDDVLGAPGDPKVAIGVNAAEIARVEPAIGQQNALVGRVIDIARRDARPLHHHEPDLIYAVLADDMARVIDIDDLDLRIRQAKSCRTIAGIAVSRRLRDVLRVSVAP